MPPDYPERETLDALMHPRGALYAFMRDLMDVDVFGFGGTVIITHDPEADYWSTVGPFNSPVDLVAELLRMERELNGPANDGQRVEFHIGASFLPHGGVGGGKPFPKVER